jgi:hypothetical protein
MGPNADKSGLKKQDDHDGMEANNIVVFFAVTSRCFPAGANLAQGDLFKMWVIHLTGTLALS